jgi:ABC-type glycerol-3-phosphate transport system substrate-binding protein
LASAGKPMFSIAGGETDAWVLTDLFENVYLRTAGSDNYRKLTKHEIPWTDDTVKKALAALADIFSKPKWLAGGTEGVLATGFPTSVHQVFDTPSKARMVSEGDFLTAFISPAAMPDADFFDFPAFPSVREQSVIVGGNVAVLPKPGPDQQENCGAKELMRALTTAETVEPWATIGGGFSSANGNIAPKLPNEPAKKAAFELQTQRIMFDMSDQQPPGFGATPGKGMFAILRDFVRNPSNIDGTAAQLEQARRTAT